MAEGKLDLFTEADTIQSRLAADVGPLLERLDKESKRLSKAEAWAGALQAKMDEQAREAKQRDRIETEARSTLGGIWERVHRTEAELAAAQARAEAMIAAAEDVARRIPSPFADNVVSAIKHAAGDAARPDPETSKPLADLNPSAYYGGGGERQPTSSDDDLTPDGTADDCDHGGGPATSCSFCDPGQPLHVADQLVRQMMARGEGGALSHAVKLAAASDVPARCQHAVCSCLMGGQPLCPNYRPGQAASGTPDLMKALRASVDAARARRMSGTPEEKR
jgi:hypothetical protein